MTLNLSLPLPLPLSYSMSAYNPDGAWHEGPQYWSYGTQFAVYLVSAQLLLSP